MKDQGVAHSSTISRLIAALRRSSDQRNRDRWRPDRRGKQGSRMATGNQTSDQNGPIRPRRRRHAGAMVVVTKGGCPTGVGDLCVIRAGRPMARNAELPSRSPLFAQGDPDCAPGMKPVKADATKPQTASITGGDRPRHGCRRSKPKNGRWGPARRSGAPAPERDHTLARLSFAHGAQQRRQAHAGAEHGSEGQHVFCMNFRGEFPPVWLFAPIMCTSRARNG